MVDEHFDDAGELDEQDEVLEGEVDRKDNRIVLVEVGTGLEEEGALRGRTSGLQGQVGFPEIRG